MVNTNQFFISLFHIFVQIVSLLFENLWILEGLQSINNFWIYFLTFTPCFINLEVSKYQKGLNLLYQHTNILYCHLTVQLQDHFIDCMIFNSYQYWKYWWLVFMKVTQFILIFHLMIFSKCILIHFVMVLADIDKLLTILLEFGGYVVDHHELSMYKLYFYFHQISDSCYFFLIIWRLK